MTTSDYNEYRQGTELNKLCKRADSFIEKYGNSRNEWVVSKRKRLQIRLFNNGMSIGGIAQLFFCNKSSVKYNIYPQIRLNKKLRLCQKFLMS